MKLYRSVASNWMIRTIYYLGEDLRVTIEWDKRELLANVIIATKDDDIELFELEKTACFSENDMIDCAELAIQKWCIGLLDEVVVYSETQFV